MIDTKMSSQMTAIVGIGFRSHRMFSEVPASQRFTGYRVGVLDLLRIGRLHELGSWPANVYR